MFMNIVLPLVFVGDYVYARCCWRGTRSDVFTRGMAMCDVSLFLWAMLWGLGSFFGVVFGFSDSVYCAHRFYLWRFFALRCVVLRCVALCCVSLRCVALCCVAFRFVAFCYVTLRFQRVLTCARMYCEDLLMHRIWNNLKAIAKVGMRAPIPFNSDVCNISKEVRIEHKLHINNIVSNGTTQCSHVYGRSFMLDRKHVCWPLIRIGK